RFVDRLHVGATSCRGQKPPAADECQRGRQKRTARDTAHAFGMSGGKPAASGGKLAGNRASPMNTPFTSGPPTGGSAMPPKNVLLGVSGGIAAYTTPDLVRRLAARGCRVQVVMSHGASRFVTATTLQAVSGRRVRDDLWDDAAEAAMGHIELARWADVVLVAPATAHFLGALAAGLAGDLLQTLCLATAAPIVVRSEEHKSELPSR